jgi:hypothetical protein
MDWPDLALAMGRWLSLYNNRPYEMGYCAPGEFGPYVLNWTVPVGPRPSVCWLEPTGSLCIYCLLFEELATCPFIAPVSCLIASAADVCSLRTQLGGGLSLGHRGKKT